MFIVYTVRATAHTVWQIFPNNQKKKKLKCVKMPISMLKCIFFRQVLIENIKGLLGQKIYRSIFSKRKIDRFED